MDWIKKARNHISLILQNLPGNIYEQTVDAGFDIICKEIEKIPVPFIGTILANTLRNTLKPDDNNSSIRNVLQILKNIEASNDSFTSGMYSIGIDVERLGKKIDSIYDISLKTYQKLSTPELNIGDPDLRISYPVNDNEFEFALMNIGGGAIKVPEIELLVVDKTPEVRIDYSVPAAPPSYLYLKVNLSLDIDRYPLFELNDESFRHFGALTDGAEYIVIQMSSNVNARYFIRIRIPYKDLESNEEKELFYPPKDKPPMEVPFWYAPAWNDRINPESMLDRKEVLFSILTTFKKVAEVLKDANPSEDYSCIDKLDNNLYEAGMQIGINDFPGMHDMLVSFMPGLSTMANLEKEPIVFESIMKLAHQLLRFSPISPMSGAPSSELLSNIVKRPDLKDQITGFFLNMNEQNRNRELINILAKVNR